MHEILLSFQVFICLFFLNSAINIMPYRDIIVSWDFDIVTSLVSSKASCLRVRGVLYSAQRSVWLPQSEPLPKLLNPALHLLEVRARPSICPRPSVPSSTEWNTWPRGFCERIGPWDAPLQALSVQSQQKFWNVAQFGNAPVLFGSQ